MIAALVLAFAGVLAPRGDRVEELETVLNSGKDWDRRDAVIELAKIDTLAAWKLVIGALDDQFSKVADEAQLQIAAIDDDKARELLAGKDGLESKNALIRARVAEALGRMSQPPPTVMLSSAMSDKDAFVRRTGAWSLERLARGGKFEGAELVATTMLPALAIQMLGREKDAETKAAFAIAANVAVGRVDASSLVPLSTDKLAPVRAAALILARELPQDAGLPVARKLGADPAVGVRLNAAELLASYRSKSAVLALVDQLESEKELRPRWRVVELLRSLSGQQHRLDARPWRDWANALPADWHGEKVEPPKHGDEGATASFAGLPLLSERVCFVIDLSGSVWQKDKQGRTKKQAIDEELERALRSLTPATEFNVIPYTSKPIPWQERLVPANEKNVAKALEFFQKRSDTGTGNFWDAWLLALEDERVDTVVMLSDGAPTGGDRWNLGLMRELMAEKNRFRRVALDAVLADASPKLKDDWRAMCDASGGRWVEIALK